MSQEGQFNDFEIDVDLEHVQPMDGTYQLVPAGEYKLDVVDVIQKPSSNNNPMVVVTFTVAEGEFQGQKLWGNYVLVPQSMGRLKQLMIACNANLDKFRAAELMGAQILATVVHNQGDARVGVDGTPQAAKTFANVGNERPLEAPATTTKAATTTTAAAPPITKGKTANGQPAGRRA